MTEPTEANHEKNIRLKSIKATDFKRFSNLTVQKIPESAKLIMLAGPNGSGKSSLFDAMDIWYLTTCEPIPLVH
jgi:predicted ATP-binding protein involved in virulence